MVTPRPDIALARAYDPPGDDGRARLLVDRLWPRGMSRERLRLDAWLKELAPSDELRRWFGHDPAKWEEFRRRYFDELAARDKAVAELLGMIGAGRTTLLFAARDRQHNNAVALRDYLQERLSPQARTGKERS